LSLTLFQIEYSPVCRDSQIQSLRKLVEDSCKFGIELSLNDEIFMLVGKSALLYVYGAPGMLPSLSLPTQSLNNQCIDCGKTLLVDHALKTLDLPDKVNVYPPTSPSPPLSNKCDRSLLLRGLIVLTGLAMRNNAGCLAASTRNC
jgi:hypothetical protein